MDEIIKLAPIVVAAGSLCLNIYLGWLLRNRPTKLARNEEIRTKLYEMKHKFEETSLIKVAPHYELWEYGFERLEELREGSSRCHVLLESVPEGRIPKDVRSVVQLLFEDVKGLYQYRDSYTRFSKGKPITSQEVIQRWPDFENAKNALSVLQSDFRAKKSVIEAYITSLY